MIDELIHIVNRIWKDLSSKHSHVHFYGLTETIAVQKENNEVEIFPVVVGTEKYAGFDDAFSLVVYHKLISGTGNTQRSNPGYGNEDNRQAVTWTLSAFGYYDPEKIGLPVDEVSLRLSAAFPESNQLKVDGFQKIKFTLNGIILNPGQILRPEYGLSYSPDPGKQFFQINYQIETVFSKKCFAKCL